MILIRLSKNFQIVPLSESPNAFQVAKLNLKNIIYIIVAAVVVDVDVNIVTLCDNIDVEDIV